MLCQEELRNYAGSDAIATSRKRVENKKGNADPSARASNSNMAAPKVKELFVIHQEKGIHAVVSLISYNQYGCRVIRP